MGSDEKLIKKIFRSEIPKDITFQELKRLLKNVGFVLQNQRGSHHSYKHAKLKYILTITAHSDKEQIKPVYIKIVKDALEDIGINGEQI